MQRLQRKVLLAKSVIGMARTSPPEPPKRLQGVRETASSDISFPFTEFGCKLAVLLKLI